MAISPDACRKLQVQGCYLSEFRCRGGGQQWVWAAYFDLCSVVSPGTPGVAIAEPLAFASSGALLM